MDSLTLLGLCFGLLAIASSQIFEGADPTFLLNTSAFIIVLGGTLGAVMVQTPLSVFRRSFSMLHWIFFPPKISEDEIKKTIIEWCKKSRQYGLLSLEKEVKNISNPIARLGLDLVVSGIDKDTIRKILEIEVDNAEAKGTQAARVFESMGGYSPTIGIIGAVIGLIQVMRHLTDPSQLGVGIAVAFVATIYGVGFANLVFLPVSNKLKHCLYRQTRRDEMIVEGIVSLANGESPNLIELKMNSFCQEPIKEK